MGTKVQLIVGDIIDLTGTQVENDLETIWGEVITVTDEDVLIRPEGRDKTISLFSLEGSVFPLPVRRYDKWGYVDNQGTIILPFDYDDAGSFKNGLAYVWLHNKGLFINVRGEWVSDTETLKPGEMIIYVLQSEGLSDDGRETVLGVFQSFENAAVFLRGYRNLYYEALSLGGVVPTVFDQKNCYWDAFHCLTIRERVVPKVNKGAFVYSVNRTKKANVIDVQEKALFFSAKNDLLNYLEDNMGGDGILGLRPLDDRVAQMESEQYTVGVFVLQ